MRVPGLSLSFLLAAVLAAAAMAVPAAEPEPEPERERELFRAAYAAAERGDFSVVEGLAAEDRRRLEAYVLWPDLRAAYLRARLGSVDAAEIETFLASHGTLKPARELRYRYALDLARRGASQAYLDLYRTFYQGLDIARLDCLALAAEIDTGLDKGIVARALRLWFVGYSQADECDPVFDHLRDRQALGREHYVARYQLAIDAENFRLARWLGKSIDSRHVAAAESWLRASEHPEDFLRAYESLDDDAAARQRLAYAARRLTYRDAELAYALWSKVRPRFGFEPATLDLTDRHIALWTARDGLPGAWSQLARLPDSAVDAEVLRWRARSSLKDGAWERLLGDILAMPDAERHSDEWRYWRAVALEALDNADAAGFAFAELARERSYYGFLAADAIDADYAFGHTPTAADEAVIARLAAKPSIVRARELFLVGLESRGRSEWAAATSALPAAEKTQAAVLADRWGWHSRAIATAASVGLYDDLALRYPLPFRATVEQHAKSADIEPTWVYGIARSESLFMADVRSSAGAIGLMQLMPATARQVADELRLPYNGLATLTDPDASLRLGTTYLASMAARYAGNRVLATAAYNAGPHRVDRWMPAGNRIDARVWIENIPFNETRAYVKRVLAADTIFRWRLDGSMQRVTERLVAIGEDAGERRVASLVAYPGEAIDAR